MNVTDIRKAIATKLLELGIQTYAFIPDTLEPPCAYVRPGDFAYAATYETQTTIPMIVQIICPSVDTEGGQEMLDELIDSESIGSVIRKLREDESLGGVVESMAVVQHRNYGTVIHAETNTKYWSAEIVLDIFAK